MEYNSLRLIFTIIIAFLVTFTATPIVKYLAIHLGAVDTPKDERRMHKQPIPLLGGLAIFYGFIVALLCFIDITGPVKGLLLGSVIIVSMGVIDDVKPLSPVLRLVGQTAAALIAIYYGIKIEFIANPNIFSDVKYISFGIFAIPITIIWIVGLTNALNLLDGLDGLSVGVSSIISVSLFSISLITNNTDISIITAAVAGAGFGFLPYNFNPAKIFQGDAGAMFFGYILACVSIMGLFKSYSVISVSVPFLLLGLPIFDMAFAMLRRIAKGKSPMSPDKGHIHHRLIDLGLTQRQAVGVLYLVSALLSLSAVVLLLGGATRALVFVVAITALVTLGAFMWTRKNTAADTTDESEQSNEPAKE